MDFKKTRVIVIERPYFANLREIELTEPTEDAFVAKATYCAISTGTDMKTYKGMQHPEQCYYPLVPGYEAVGVVVEAPKPGVDLSRIPESARNIKLGDKDSLTTNDSFDYMVKIPDNVTDVQAVLAYLASVPHKGIKRMTLRPNETFVVVGAGMVGISAIQILKIKEPTLKVICIERNAFRRSIAENYADVVVSPEEAVAKISELTDGKMADQLMECSGNPEVVGTLHQYIRHDGWKPGEIPAHIHLQGDYPDKIIFDHYHRWFGSHATITMSCARIEGGEEEILKWMSEGKFDTSKLPIEVWPVSKCTEAFEYLNEKGADCFKILFDWSK